MSRKRVKMVDTVAGVALQRVGFVKGRQALMFIACWWIASADLGRAPETIDEYVAWWRDKSRAQAFRDQAAFRAAFPEHATPTSLAEALGIDVTGLHRGSESAVVGGLIGTVMA